MKTISMTLSPESIDKAIESLKRYDSSIDDKTLDAVNFLTIAGQEFAKAHWEEGYPYPYATGETEDSINIELSSNTYGFTGLICAGGHAENVEYALWTPSWVARGACREPRPFMHKTAMDIRNSYVETFELAFYE